MASQNDIEKKKLLFSFAYSAFFVLILLLIYALDSTLNLNLYRYTLYPRTTDGLIGIITSPLVHGSLSHWFSNAMPLLVMGTIISYFYRQIAFRVFFLVYFLTGISVWLFARESYHLGASGLVYAFVCFIFFSGVIRMDVKLLMLSLLVTFLYGSLVWGTLPIDKDISWESHILGSIAGIIAALVFRKQGPQRKIYEWEEEDEAETDVSTEDFNIHPETENKINITYIYKPNNKNESEENP